METWKNAGVPLEAVLRGIDESFDKWEKRPRRTRKVNGLAYCAQEVLGAAEEMKDAAVGAAPARKAVPGLEHSEVAAFLRRNAHELAHAPTPERAQAVARETAAVLRSLADGVEQGTAPPTEDLERRLTVSEEKLIAALLAATSDDALFQVRSEADRDLAPYRSKMTAPQIEQLHKQYVQKRLLEQYRVPRLSLFYM
jgi:plasmid stabilization system protein ParE